MINIYFWDTEAVEACICRLNVMMWCDIGAHRTTSDHMGPHWATSDHMGIHGTTTPDFQK